MSFFGLRFPWVQDAYNARWAGAEEERRARAELARERAEDLYSRRVTRERERDLAERVPQNIGLLERAALGRPYTAYTTGAALDATPEDPDAVEFGGLPPGAVMREEPQAVQGRARYNSTGEMLVEDPRARQAYGELLETGLNPYGKGKGGMGRPTIEDTNARMAQESRIRQARDQATASADELEALRDTPTSEAADRALIGHAATILRSVTTMYPDRIPANIGELHKTIRDAIGRRETAAAIRDTLEVFAGMGRGEPQDPIAIGRIITAAVNHPQSPFFRQLVEGAVLPFVQGAAYPAETKAVAAWAGAFLKDISQAGDPKTRMDRAGKAMIDAEPEGSARLFLVPARPGMKGLLPEPLRKWLGLPAEIQAAEQLADARETDALAAQRLAEAGKDKGATKGPDDKAAAQRKARLDQIAKEENNLVQELSGLRRGAAGMVGEGKKRVGELQKKLDDLRAERDQLSAEPEKPTPATPAPARPGPGAGGPAAGGGGITQDQARAARDTVLREQFGGRPWATLTPQEKEAAARAVNARLGTLR